ncbi:MAG: hypothetical protein V1747_02555 [Candidatus Omnitrophota bacterium]
MDINGFFKLFIGSLLLGILIFGFMNSNFEFECPLLKGGYYRVKWIKDEKKFDLLYWQPKKNVKPLPKDSIVIQGEKPVVKEKSHF